MGRPLPASADLNRWRGRPKNQDAYPIYPCQDGYVRLCVMSPRQWRGLRRWLGEPEEFQDPKYDVIAARFAAWPQIGKLVQQLFADQTMKALVPAGQAHGVPIAAVLSPAQILASDHFQAVGAIADAELVPGVHACVPTGYFAVDGQHIGFRTPAPPAGHDEARWLAGPAATPTPRNRSAVPSRAANPRPRCHRRRRRTQPPVWRSGRRGHQSRKCGLSRRIASGTGRRGHE